jgi:hypothetical protein
MLKQAFALALATPLGGVALLLEVAGEGVDPLAAEDGVPFVPAVDGVPCPPFNSSICCRAAASLTSKFLTASGSFKYERRWQQLYDHYI